MAFNTNDHINKGSIYLLIISFVIIAVSGLVFAMTFLVMDTVNTQLLTVDCVFEGNNIVSTCQELYEITLKPFLALKDVLVLTSFISIFALVAGLLVFGYQSGTRPTLLGVLMIGEMLLTYASLHVANIYRTLLENVVVRDMLTNFTVYHKIMWNFPWFVFVVSLFSIALGVVNWQRTNVNSPQGQLDY